MTNASAFRIMITMKTTNTNRLNRRFRATTTCRRRFHPVFAAAVALLIGAAFVSCSSAPAYPAFPPPLTGTVPVDHQRAFQIARSVLNEDPRLDVHTVDKDGRFVAFEKTSGILFFQKRTILDIRIEPIDAEETKITMRLKAEAYTMGGLKHAAGWYPSSKVNTVLGEDVMALIERKINQTDG